MGINTLAFRMPQHGTFFDVDADCVGLTNDVPWDLNSQWLDLLARSGTPLFVSADPAAMGAAQSAALREAFSIAATDQPVAEAVDWLETTCPSHWQTASGTTSYNWFA
jgi:alpha-galactosidase